MLDAYIYAGLRTPFGRHAGALSTVRPDDLSGLLLARLAETSGFAVDDLEDVILGCTNQAGEDSRNLARNALLAAGLPARLPGQTVNRLCASGLSAVIDAARAISCGEGRLYLAGGAESMSRAPFVMAKAESAFSRTLEVFDSTIGARFANPRLVERYGNDSMPETGDNVARAFGIAREDADRFAASSQARYQAALEEGFFLGEILPVEVRAGRKGETRLVERDEHPRPQADLAALARLPALFAGGVVTAGNASGINDGAAVVLLGDRAIGEREGIRPLARILASASVGVEPRLMGIGPQQAILRALQRAGIDLDEVGLIEINEAFAPQVLACLKLLGLDYEDPRVNPHGGAIALGHPLGASGARLVLTAARGLQRIERRYAVVSLCVGLGQGVAMVIERCR
ncbi:3-oxoadipyl-CoA thiolase [Pseudomonas aeruginosa]|nr:3-oxoadipyl-CoA thiolase [Pseudomonas aeruginosa]